MFQFLAAALVAVPLLVGAPSAPGATCGDLAGERLAGATVTSAAVVTNRIDNEYCEVKGVIAPQTHFTVELPTAGWTGEYVQQGCSGLCGSVPELVAPLFGFSCTAAQAGQLVLAADDSGHTGTGPADARWGADPKLREVFGLTSEHSLNLVATATMRAFYGHGPTYRYFDGCSTGGRQALNLAQRYPDDFDGILAGAPALDLARLDLVNAWVVTHNIGPDGRQILGPDKMPALIAAVGRKCGAIVQDPRGCGFQPSSLRCPPGVDNAGCLTKAQVGAVTAFYAAGVPKGSESSWVNQFVDPNGNPRNTLSGQIGTGYFQYLAYPHNPPAGFDLADVRFTRAELARLEVVAQRIYNADNPDLSRFRAHGGKLIMYHGWADASIPPAMTLGYYAAVERRAGGFAAAQRFSRLYMVPGGNHCLFGPDPITPTEIGYVEFLTPLMDWVERGTAPGTLDAPTIDAADYHVVRDVTIKPFDALRR
jgi:pimeloyl-ACP methyl ester carboxylesterase